jgi:hypothetical protein
LSKPNVYSVSQWSSYVTDKKGETERMYEDTEDNENFQKEVSKLHMTNPLLTLNQGYLQLIHNPEIANKEYDNQINEGADSYHNVLKNHIYNNANFVPNEKYSGINTVHDLLNVGFDVAENKKFAPYSAMSGDVKEHNDNLRQMYKRYTGNVPSKTLELFSANHNNRLLIGKHENSPELNVISFRLSDQMEPEIQKLIPIFDPKKTQIESLYQSLGFSPINMRYGTTYNIKEPKEMIE